MKFEKTVDIFKKEAQIKQQIENSTSLKDKFSLLREYDWLFKLAEETRQKENVDRIRKHYEETGECSHCFENDYNSRRSTLQDKTCIVCGEKMYYMGDD